MEDTKFTRAKGEEEPEELKRTRTTRGLAAGKTGYVWLNILCRIWTTQNKGVEAWNKMNNDPLLAMKQREMQARENIASNPVRREQIRREVDERKRRKKRKSEREERSQKTCKERTPEGEVSRKNQERSSRRREKKRGWFSSSPSS